jgi:hypothetical protein
LRFIAFIECATEDLDRFIEVWESRTGARHTVKTVLPPHTIAETQRGYSGFSIFETDDIEDIMHYVTEYGQLAKVKILPIWESKKGAALYRSLERGSHRK